MALLRKLLSACQDEKAQDLIEYALLTGFMCLTVGIVLPPEAVHAISNIYSRIDSLLIALALQ